MDMWGLILSGIGAVLIAAGQELVASVTAVWLRAHESFLDSLAAVVRKNQWLSRVGWSLFVVGIVLQIIPHFRHDGWKALCEPLFNLCSL